MKQETVANVCNSEFWSNEASHSGFLSSCKTHTFIGSFSAYPFHSSKKAILLPDVFQQTYCIYRPNRELPTVR